MLFIQRIIFAFLSMCFLLPFTSFAADTFIIKNIQVEGLQGISSATVKSYLPLKEGQTLDPADTTALISALYKTGFFEDVSLSHRDNTLIIHVVERPVISSIKVNGNSSISSEQINSVLKELKLEKGEILNKSILDQVVKSLKSAYSMQGRYNAQISSTVEPVGPSRVNVSINISEGRVALVKKIQIIGNEHFDNDKLLKQLTLTPTKWNSLFTRHDHYSKDSLNDSLERLTNYYLDRGYLKFKVDSANSILTPDRKSIYVLIHITEGPQYKLKSIHLAGNLIFPRDTLLSLPALQALKPGVVFSKREIMAATKAITIMLGEQGYIFADVNVVPDVIEKTKEIQVTFHVNPGNRIYIRRIAFSGNTVTKDSVLRNAMRQVEGAVASTKNISESERQLNLLGFFQNVRSDLNPVPNSQNQADLNFSVTETPSAQATIAAGYGTDGLTLNAGINESNFLGTGKSVGINFVRNIYQRSYSFSYNNPYYTKDGVQRGFTLYNTRTTPGEVNLASYSFTNYGANLLYTIPFTERDSYQFGIGLQRTVLEPNFDPSLQIQQFVKNEGSAFNELMLTGGWTRNSLDRSLFPTKGTIQALGLQVSAPFIGPSLDYYKLTYQFHNYFPIAYGFIGALAGTAGYGGGYGKTAGLPFFVNYYAGGMGYTGAVRGYQTNSLGPKDSQAEPLGGNALLVASSQLILPRPLSADSFRSSVFVDAGNVYQTKNLYNTYPENEVGISLGKLRYSAGIDVQWRLPVLNAILEVSIAKALNPKDGDSTQPFSFQIGGSF